MSQFFHHHGVHEVVVVAQYPQLSRRNVELVQELASLLRYLSVHEFVDVAEELLTFPPEVEGLLLLHVEQMLVLVLPNVLRLHSTSELGLAVF